MRVGTVEVDEIEDTLFLRVRGRGLFAASFQWTRPLDTYPAAERPALRRKVRRLMMKALRQRVLLTAAAWSVVFRKGGLPS